MGSLCPLWCLCNILTGFIPRHVKCVSYFLHRNHVGETYFIKTNLILVLLIFIVYIYILIVIIYATTIWRSSNYILMVFLSCRGYYKCHVLIPPPTGAHLQELALACCSTRGAIDILYTIQCIVYIVYTCQAFIDQNSRCATNPTISR